MYVRERSRVMPGPEGYAKRWVWGGTPRQWHLTFDQTISYYAREEQMEDVVGNQPDPNAAVKTTLTRRGGIVNYIKTAGFTDYKIVNWPIQASHILSVAHLPVVGQPSFPDAATMTAARTNPSQPSVGLAVSIAELKDIPRMIHLRSFDEIEHIRRFGRQPGTGKGGRGSNSVLASEFGYQPIIRDIQSVFRIPQLIESRLKTIRRLGKGATSRTRDLFAGFNSSEQNSTVTMCSQPITLTSTKQYTRTHETWQGTARWEANFDIGSLTDSEMLKLAARVSTGLDASQLLSGAWELLPWSWLIDYFGNVGDLLSLTQNALASPVGPVCVSVVKETEKTWYSGQPDIHTDFVMKLRSWQREVVYPGLSFRVPLLTHGQLSILSALAHNNAPQVRGPVEPDRRSFFKRLERKHRLGPT